MERAPEHSHGGATGFKPPPGVTVHTIPQDKSIGSMMLSGELQAALHYIVNDNLIDRSTADLHSHPDIKLLFPDRTAEGVRYYTQDRHLSDQPRHGGEARGRRANTLGLSAICSTPTTRANAKIDRQRMEQLAYHIETGLLPAGAREKLREPLVQHGIKANRHTLETCAQYSNEQGLTPRVMRLDEIFEPSTMER